MNYNWTYSSDTLDSPKLHCFSRYPIRYSPCPSSIPITLFRSRCPRPKKYRKLPASIAQLKCTEPLQALLERLEKERLERERKRKEEAEIYAASVKREREEQAKKEKLLRASDLKKRLEAEEAKKKSSQPPKETEIPPKPEANMKIQKPLNNIRLV